MLIPVGSRELELGSSALTELRDCNDLLTDRDALQTRMADDGYLLIRGLFDRETIMTGRRRILQAADAEGMIAPNTDIMDAVIHPEPKGNVGNGRKGVTHTPEVLAVLEGDPVMNFFSFFFNEPALTFDYKWMRLVPTGVYTGAHYDVVYMGRGTQDHLFTMWTPFGDVPYEHGPLALCVGSHNQAGFEKLRQTYGKMDVDRDLVGGWFEDDPKALTDKFGGQWQTTQFEAGDVLLFPMLTMHMSVKNQTDRYRLSTDTRYQPASAPIDQRWVGDNPIAHYAWNADASKQISMADAREKWGV